MKRFLLVMIVAISILGCGQKSTENAIWREDFRITRLPWQTVLGTPNWIIDRGVYVVLGAAPFEQLSVVDRDWQGNDFELGTSLRLGEKGETGVVLGYKDKDDFWRVTLDNSENRIALIRRMGGIDSVEAEGSISLSHREFHKIIVEASKTEFKVKCDGLVVFTTARPDGITGRFGLYTGIFNPVNERIYANYEYLEVRPIP